LSDAVQINKVFSKLIPATLQFDSPSLLNVNG